MSIKVHLPDGRIVNFPDGMAPDAIQAEVTNLAPVKTQDANTNRDFLDSQPVDAPQTGPRPGSPQAVLEGASTKLFGDYAPMANAAASFAAKSLPVIGAGAEMLDSGAPAGGALGGVVGTALGGPGGGIAGATAGGGAGGAIRRWFRGEPTTGGDVALDSTVQGGLQAVTPVIGSAVSAVARPMYRAALRPGAKLVEAFGDLAGRGLKEGLPVTAASIPEGQAAMSASRAEAMRQVAGAERAGASRVLDKEIQPALDPVFTEARNASAVGGEPPVARLIDRSQKLGRTLGGPGVPLTRAQTLKEAAQDEASGAFAASDRGARVATLDDAAAKKVAEALQRAIEQRVPGVAKQNLNTKELIGLVQALDKAETRRLAGGSALPTTIPSAIAKLLGGANAGSRAAILMDRSGRAIKGSGVDPVSSTVRALQLLIQQQDEQP